MDQWETCPTNPECSDLHFNSSIARPYPGRGRGAGPKAGPHLPHPATHPHITSTAT